MRLRALGSYNLISDSRMRRQLVNKSQAALTCIPFLLSPYYVIISVHFPGPPASKQITPAFAGPSTKPCTASSMDSNLNILTQSHRAVAAKKREKRNQIKEIVFDDDARRYA